MKQIEVQNGMDCSQTKFVECVHKPCAINLRPGGLCSIHVLSIIPICEWPEHPVSWRSCSLPQLGFYALAIALLPLLSSLKEFKSVLNKERQSNGKLHEQIEAVEAMIERQNHRQGFGIPVFDGFVITWGWLNDLHPSCNPWDGNQSLSCAKELVEELMPCLADMQKQLNNLTVMLSSTNHT